MSLQTLRTRDEQNLGPDPIELLLSEVEAGHKLLEAAKRATRPERGARFYEVACAVANDLEARVREVQRDADRNRLTRSLRALEFRLVNDRPHTLSHGSNQNTISTDR